jgi:Tat protein secretion system quality control protein TatD with DNase activity
MRGLWLLLLIALSLLARTSAASAGERLPIIDAHSQLEHEIAPERVIELMDAAHVSRTILAARRKTTIKDMIALAREYPDRITAAVRTKGGAYQDKPVRAFKKFLGKQLKHPEFAAMAEVLMFHARKTNKKGKTIAPQVAFLPGHAKPAAALDVALSKGWPFIIHIEFASLGAKRGKYMKAMESMLRAHPKHPFVLIHMGQLGPKDAERLLAAHPNLSFIPAHTTPVTLAESHEPWTAMFKGHALSVPWRDLILRHPERFVLGFDNVWAQHWEEFYVPQVRLWRRILGELPEDVAHAVAHRNAERLWHLPPAE